MVLEVAAAGGAMVHLYGVTEGGLTVRAEVGRFWPFLYCKPTVHLADGSRRDIREEDLPLLRKALEEELTSSRAAKQLAKQAPPPPAAAAAAASSTPKKGAKAAPSSGSKKGGSAAAASSFFKAKPSAASSKASAIDVDDEDDDAGGDEEAEEEPSDEDEAEDEDEEDASAGGRGCVVAMKLVQKRSLMYYRGPELSTFVQVWLASPTLLTPAHQALSKKLKLASPEATAPPAAASNGSRKIKVCPLCTLHNEAPSSTCSACDSALPAAVSSPGASSSSPSAAASSSSNAVSSFSSAGELFGTNIEHYMRFMVSSNIVGGGWADARRYELVPSHAKRTRCDLELRCTWSDDPELQPLVGLPTDMQSIATAKIAPLRVLSFDIQPLARQGNDVTSDPSRDPVLAIANQAAWFPAQIDPATGAAVPPVRVLFMLRTAVGPSLPNALVTAPGMEIVWCASEADLLRKWRDFFLAIDADIVTGFDIAQRDIPFLLARAERYERNGGKADDASQLHGPAATLSPPPAAKRGKKSPAASPASSLALSASERATSADFSNWRCLGRDGRIESELKNIQTYGAGWVRSKKRMTATSNQASAYFRMEGRLFFDCQRIIQTQHSLCTYSLQECAQEFLRRTEEYLDDAILNGLLQQASAPMPKAPSGAVGVQARTKSDALRAALDHSATPAAAAAAAAPATAAPAAAAAPSLPRKMTAKDRKRRREIDYEDLTSPSPTPTPSPPPVSPLSVEAAADAAAIAAIPTVPSLTNFESPLRSFTRYASYALRQAELPLLLLEALTIVVASMELSRTTGINVKDVWTRGQMIRTWSLLLRHCHSSKERYIVPAQRENSQGQTMTSGPWIFDCIALGTTGLHQDPVATLDFNSLYPSIMIGYNLCYSTIVVREDEDKIVPNDQTTMTPIHRRFVLPAVRKGVVPQILEWLIEARRQVRKLQKDTPDAFLKSVLEERQKALKISANATYGFTGSSASKLLLVELAEATINYGSRLLQQAAAWVDERFGKGAKGKSDGEGADAEDRVSCCEVIYGDTDSLMIKMHGLSVSEAIALAQRISRSVTDSLPSPITFGYEKVYQPFLLQQNKKYSARKFILDDNPATATLDVKGMESVRRDIIPVVRLLMEEVLRLLLMDGDMPAAIARTKDAIRMLLSDGYTLADLRISKALWRGTDSEQYGTRVAHVELAEKLKRRYPGREIALGQRLSYVLVQGEKGVKQWQQSEEPSYAWAHGLALDLDLYLTNYLQKPLVRLFCLPGLLGSVEKATKVLFQGEHVRAVKRTAPGGGGDKPGAGGGAAAGEASKTRTLGAFFKKDATAHCKHCKRPITSGALSAAAPTGKAAGATATGQKTLAFSRMGAKPKPSAAAPAAAASSSSKPASAAPVTMALCGECRTHLDRVVLSRVAEYAAREEQLAALAQACHHCQCGGGAATREILCVNEDCKIYWSRMKTWRSVEEAQEFLRQLDW